MAKCAICEKGNQFGKKVSMTRSKVSGRSNRMWKPNVKSVKVNVNGSAQKMYVCTSCLRAGYVERA
ncbi:MAG: 50S ribosomal protein L28 [Lachnospiraceae bacterium]|nr:50S ribosomal protein L28 [Lachnospiraceae bacterium]